MTLDLLEAVNIYSSKGGRPKLCGNLDRIIKNNDLMKNHHFYKYCEVFEENTYDTFIIFCDKFYIEADTF